MSELMEGMIPNHKDLSRVLVRLPDGRELTYHSFKPLKKGDVVVIKGGMYRGRFGVIVKKKSKWDGYTYRCAKSKPPKVENDCPNCGLPLKVVAA